MDDRRLMIAATVLGALARQDGRDPEEKLSLVRGTGRHRETYEERRCDVLAKRALCYADALLAAAGADEDLDDEDLGDDGETDDDEGEPQ
jgi:hypothetical protein